MFAVRIALATAFTLALTGCTASFQQSAELPAAADATPVSGRVFGGQQPIVGATIQLYAASTAGYSAAATPLLTVPVLSGVGGNFSISYDYACPSSSTQVYLTATGGNPGLGTGLVNPQSALVAALGSCGNLSTSTNIVINELTTVAAVWALAPFMTDISHVGTSSSNVVGLTNAFVSASQLVNVGNGNTPGIAPAGAIIPYYALDTLANILSSCVNSSGGTAGDTTSCGKLFTYATPSGGSAPTNTVAASLAIAQHPGLNVAKIFALSSATPAFSPAFATAPNDFTLGIAYVGFGAGVSHLAIDNAQNVWGISNSGIAYITNDGYTVTSVYKPASLGAASIAIDAGGFVWIGGDKVIVSGQNTLFYCATKINLVGFDLIDIPCETYVSSNGITTTTYPGGITASSTLTAIGPSSEVWFPTSNTLAEFTGGGSPVTPNGVAVTNSTSTTGGASGGGYTPGRPIEGMAIDPAGNAWIDSIDANANRILSKFSAAGVALSPSTGYTGGGLSKYGTNGPSMAIDRNNNVWISQQSHGSLLSVLAEFGPTGVAISPAAGYPSTIDAADGIYIDGDNTVWQSQTGCTGCGFTHTANSGADLTLAASLWLPDGNKGENNGNTEPTGSLAIDSAGNIWSAGFFYNSGAYAIFKMVGLAAPVVTPLALAVKNNQLGTRP